MNQNNNGETLQERPGPMRERMHVTANALFIIERTAQQLLEDRPIVQVPFDSMLAMRQADADAVKYLKDQEQRRGVTPDQPSTAITNDTESRLAEIRQQIEALEPRQSADALEGVQ